METECENASGEGLGYMNAGEVSVCGDAIAYLDCKLVGFNCIQRMCGQSYIRKYTVCE